MPARVALTEAAQASPARGGADRGPVQRLRRFLPLSLTVKLPLFQLTRFLIVAHPARSQLSRGGGPSCWGC